MTIGVPIDPTLVAASGSVGDITYGHNQWGPWTRERITPADPASALQVAVRGYFATLSAAWSNDLTQAQRDAWTRYADRVPLTGPTGRTNTVPGLQQFVRSNVARLQTAEPSLPRQDDAPTIYTLGSFSSPSRIVLNVVDDTAHPFFDDANAWATESGAAMIFWASRPVPLTVNFHKGPYQYAGALLGSSPRNTSPGTVPLPFPADADQRVFLRGQVTRDDGRLSTSFRYPAVIVPQVAPLPLSAVFTPLIFPRARVDVTFDALIRSEPRFNGNWTVRRGNSIWSVIATSTLDDVVRLIIINVGVQIGPNLVTFTPPPDDVNGLLTGLAVAPFSIPML